MSIDYKVVGLNDDLYLAIYTQGQDVSANLFSHSLSKLQLAYRSAPRSESKVELSPGHYACLWVGGAAFYLPTDKAESIAAELDLMLFYTKDYAEDA